MITIWDNGCSYSDHEVVFVDTGDDEEILQRVQNVIKCFHPRWSPGWKIVASASVIEWRDGRSKTLEEFVGSMTEGLFVGDNDNIDAIEVAIRSLPPHLAAIVAEECTGAGSGLLYKRLSDLRSEVAK